MAKEAYSYVKRGLFIWQKRPMNTGFHEPPTNVDDSMTGGSSALLYYMSLLHVFTTCLTAYERGRQHDGRL